MNENSVLSSSIKLFPEMNNQVVAVVEAKQDRLIDSWTNSYIYGDKQAQEVIESTVNYLNNLLEKQ